jgi:hypothetical protein
LEYLDANLVYNKQTFDLESEKGDENGLLNFDISVSSLNANQQTPLTYRVEALPLDHLSADGDELDSKQCQNDLTKSVRCFETNLLKKYNLEECQTQLSANLSYTYDNEQLYKDKVEILVKKYNVKFNVKCK